MAYVESYTAASGASPSDVVSFVTSRQAALYSIKNRFIPRFQELADYCNPIRENIRGYMLPGQRKSLHIYDGTARSAIMTMAFGIQGYHISAAFPWFKYGLNVPGLDDVKPIRQWLESCAEVMYYALNRSNFYGEMGPYIVDAASIGTATLMAEEDIASKRIIFECIHPGEVYIGTNRYGEVDVLHRKRKMTVRQMAQKFGDTDAKFNALPQRLKTSLKRSPFAEMEILHAIYPRERFDPAKIDKKNKKFASVWLLGNDLLEESGMDEFPAGVWRYFLSGKEVYGISPAWLIMPEILAINKMSKTMLAASQRAVDPPVMAHSSLKDRVQRTPGGITYYDDPNAIIKPIESGMQYPIGIDREKAKQQAIKEAFHVDLFLMLTQMEGGAKTATEVNELMAEKAAILGAELGPLNRTLDKILEIVFSIEHIAGRMPPPPSELLVAAKQNPALSFDPVYIGPLAQAQKQKFGTQGIQMGLQFAAQMIGLNPSVAVRVNWDKTLTKGLEEFGFPASCIQNDQVVQQAQQAQQQAAEQQAQAAQGQQSMEGLKGFSEADRNLGGKLSNAIQQHLTNQSGQALGVQ